MTPDKVKDALDGVYCFDAATGKTLWKTQFAGAWSFFPMSGTPAVADGKCYIWDSNGRVHCFDANTGAKIWESEQFTTSGHHDSASSVLWLDGLVVVPTSPHRGLVALDGNDGKLKWATTKLGHEDCSPGIWSKDGKKYILLNINTQLVLVDPADGRVLASMPGSGGVSTPATAGDYGACDVGGEQGVIGFTLSPSQIERLWNAPLADGDSSPVISGDYVYAVGGGYGEPKKGRALCIALKTGKLVWSEPMARAQESSPLLADGKIIVPVWGDLVFFKATPEKFTPLGRAKAGLERWASLALSDARLFVRTRKGVACYDLTK